jgi:hypothetical protein
LEDRNARKKLSKPGKDKPLQLRQFTGMHGAAPRHPARRDLPANAGSHPMPAVPGSEAQ